MFCFSNETEIIEICSRNANHTHTHTHTTHGGLGGEWHNRLWNMSNDESKDFTSFSDWHYSTHTHTHRWNYLMCHVDRCRLQPLKPPIDISIIGTAYFVHTLILFNICKNPPSKWDMKWNKVAIHHYWCCNQVANITNWNDWTNSKGVNHWKFEVCSFGGAHPFNIFVQVLLI